MKTLNFAIFFILFAILCLFFMHKNDEPPIEMTEPTIQSPDIASILNNFFSIDLPVSSLLISINDKDIEISGKLEKNLLKNYLSNQNLLDFVAELAISTFPDSVFIKFHLKTQSTTDELKIIAKKIEIENFTINTNFTLYTLNLKK